MSKITTHQLKAHYKGTTPEDERIADFDTMIKRMRDLIKKHRQEIDERTISIAALNVAINQTQVNKKEYIAKLADKDDDGTEHIIPYKEEGNDNE